MKDVADKANVSVMTVSRVINNPEKVKEVTRKKVLQVMEELAFKQNVAAKALAKNQTRTIHIFIQSVLSTQDPYLMALLAGISDVLSAAYYSFLIRREWNVPYKCDGIIALPSSQQDIKKLKASIDEPIIVFGKTKVSVDWVDFDHYRGTYLMTKFMLEKGHKNLGFLGIETEEDFALERLNGFKDALKENNLILNRTNIKMVATHTERSGYESALELLQQNAITGLVCSSDVLALGALTAAKSIGKVVPDDFSIGGFDGVFLDQMADPPLTTIEQPVHAIGQELARSLLIRIQHPELPLMEKVISPKLIIRKTVADIKP